MGFKDKWIERKKKREKERVRRGHLMTLQICHAEDRREDRKKENKKRREDERKKENLLD